MARLYANENFPLPVVEELRRLGHDVLTVLETGKAEQRWPDDEVLAFATAAERCVITINRRHFVRRHGARPAHAGIIVCTLDADFRGQAARVHAALQNHSVLSGQLLRINRPSN